MHEDSAFTSYQRRDGVWALQSHHHYYGTDIYSVGTSGEVLADVTRALRTHVWRNFGHGGWD